MMRLLLLLAVIGTVDAATTPREVTLAIVDRPAVELFELLAKQCQAGLYADPSALPALTKNVSITFAQLTWDAALDQIADRLQLDVALDEGLLHIAALDPKRPSLRYVRRVYDLRLLTSGMREHPGIELDVPVGRIPRSYIGPPPGFESETKPELNEFIEILQKSVEPASWSREGVSIEEWDGNMVIFHTPAVQQQIAQYLTRLEALAARQIICRVYRLGQVPTDTGAVLSAKQWSAFAERLPPPAAVFIARNDQTQNHFAGIQRLLVVDADQNQFLHAPIVMTLSTGLSLTVHPTATVAGIRVATKLWATVDSALPTTAVRDEAGQPLVTITTPHLTSDRSADLREIPPDGAAIYRFGERAYALTADLADLTPAESTTKP